MSTTLIIRRDHWGNIVASRRDRLWSLVRRASDFADKRKQMMKLTNDKSVDMYIHAMRRAVRLTAMYMKTR